MFRVWWGFWGGKWKKLSIDLGRISGSEFSALQHIWTIFTFTIHTKKKQLKSSHVAATTWQATVMIRRAKTWSTKFADQKIIYFIFPGQLPFILIGGQQKKKDIASYWSVPLPSLLLSWFLFRWADPKEKSTWIKIPIYPITWWTKWVTDSSRPIRKARATSVHDHGNFYRLSQILPFTASKGR